LLEIEGVGHKADKSTATAPRKTWFFCDDVNRLKGENFILTFSRTEPSISYIHVQKRVAATDSRKKKRNVLKILHAVVFTRCYGSEAYQFASSYIAHWIRDTGAVLS
jgi:hypothetical protein